MFWKHLHILKLMPYLLYVENYALAVVFYVKQKSLFRSILRAAFTEEFLRSLPYSLVWRDCVSNVPFLSDVSKK